MQKLALLDWYKWCDASALLATPQTVHRSVSAANTARPKAARHPRVITPENPSSKKLLPAQHENPLPPPDSGKAFKVAQDQLPPVPNTLNVPEPESLFRSFTRGAAKAIDTEITQLNNPALPPSPQTVQG